MKKFLFLFSVVAFTACNSSNDTTVDSMSSSDSTVTASDTTAYQYATDYSSKFEMGDAKNVRTIFDLYKDWDNNNLDNSKDKFADSVTLYFSDGSMMAGSYDSVTAAAKKFRSTLGTVNTSVHAVFPVKSADKNENWVVAWFTEYRTNAAGKKDSVQLQETWRLNKDGKADLLYQYEQKNPAPPKK